MRKATMVTALGLALASAVPHATASAQSITYDYDRTADFSSLKTYAWTSGTTLRDQLNHKRVMAAIDEQLAAKGLRKVESSDSADVLVAYHASFDQDIQVNGFSSATGGWRFANRTGSARVEKVVNGTIVVDVIDAKSETMLWRGTARKEIDPKADPEKRDRAVNKAMEKLFKNYPANE